MTTQHNTVDSARFASKTFKPLTLTDSDWAAWHRQNRGGAPSAWSAKKWVSGLQAANICTVAAFRDRERRTDAWELTLPNGASFLVARAPRYKITTTSDAVIWLHDQGVDIAAKVALHLGRSTYEVEKRRARAEKDRDAGKMTCPHCLRRVKVRGGVMVDHGFQRPGWGTNVGGCSAQRRYEPLEVSRVGLVVRVEWLQNTLTEAPTRIVEAEANVASDRNRETLHALSQARQLLRAVQSELPIFEKLLADWKPTHRLVDGQYVEIS